MLRPGNKFLVLNYKIHLIILLIDAEALRCWFGFRLCTRRLTVPLCVSYPSTYRRVGILWSGTMKGYSPNNNPFWDPGSTNPFDRKLIEFVRESEIVHSQNLPTPFGTGCSPDILDFSRDLSYQVHTAALPDLFSDHDSVLLEIRGICIPALESS